jgi:hypothetical protein
MKGEVEEREGRHGPRRDAVSPESLRDASHFRRVIAARKGLDAAEQKLRDAVAVARAAGGSWTAIGAALGTTKPGLPQRLSTRGALLWG